MRKSKNRYFTTFFPLGRRWGNHAKCCMDGKRTRCLQIVSLHVPIYLLPLIFWDTARYLWKKSSFYHTPLHSTPPLGGFPSEYRHPLWGGKTRMVSLSDGEKISKISLFVLTWSTNVTDRQTDRHCVTAKTALASHRAVKSRHLWKCLAICNYEFLHALKFNWPICYKFTYKHDISRYFTDNLHNAFCFDSNICNFLKLQLGSL